MDRPRILSFLGAALVTAVAMRSPPDPQPLTEFTAVNDDTASATPPVLEDCGYYLQIRGTTGRPVASRLGAAVQLRRDTLVVRVDSYRVSDFDPRDWQMARWTLRIGGLGAGPYRVEVVARPHRMTRNLRLSFRAGGCAA
jgi:hypothetical protein